MKARRSDDPLVVSRRRPQVAGDVAGAGGPVTWHASSLAELECVVSPDLPPDHGAREFLRALDGRLPDHARVPVAPVTGPAAANRIGHDSDAGAGPLVKSLFDLYFRNDLYEHWIDRDPIVLSSGSFDETVFGLPTPLKDAVRFALDRNWYGYSDSLGRTSARRGLAALESARAAGSFTVSEDNVAVTLGGTAAIASLADLFSREDGDRPAVCGTPNYAPLVAAVAERLETVLVRTPSVDGRTCLDGLIEMVRETNPRMVLVQTVTNPTGERVTEADLARLVEAAPTDCYIVLDECHESFGPSCALTPLRARSNVVAVRSISKRWAAPGLKAGWIVASPELLDAFYVQASTTYGGPSSLLFLFLELFGYFESCVVAGTEATEQPWFRELVAEYEMAPTALATAFDDYVAATVTMATSVTRGREHAVDALRSWGVPVLAPTHSINFVAQVGACEGSYETYRRLVSEAGVSVFPTILSYASGPGTVRLSPSLPEPVLDEALLRLGRWHAEQVG